MAGELSTILEHVERISELDLDGRRAHHPRGRARERAPRRRAAAEPAARAGARARARPRRRRLPRPVARRRERAARADRGRRPSAGSRRATSTPASTSTPTPRPPPATSSGRICGGPRPAARRSRGGELCAGMPVAVKDIFCTEGIDDHGGLADPRGLPAAVHGDRGSPPVRGRRTGARARRTWTSSRWGRRTRTPPTGRCATRGTASASPAGPPAARPRRSPGGSPRGRSAPTPAARSASRRRCAGSSA